MSISKSALGLIAAMALVISGCSSTGSDTDVTPGDAQGSADDKSEAGGPAPDPTGDDGDSEPADAGTTAEDIVATIEAMGFECEDQDRHLKTVSSAIECRADDYVYLTASQFFDPVERDSHFEEKAIPALCGDTLKMSEVHWSVRDDWMLVPGDDREMDFAAHDEASEKLEFETRTHTCDS